MHVETSPFVFDGPMPPAQLAGRDRELAALRDRATHGRFCLLYGPRRFGKTSVIGRLAYDCKTDKDLAVVVCDLQGVLSMDDISRRLAVAFSDLNHSKVRTALVRALAGVAEGGLRAAGARVGIDIGHGVLRSEDSAPSQTLEALLALPPQAAARTGTRVLVVLDEFQAIADVRQADAVLRSQIQHHRDQVSYLFSGSEQGLLRSLFSERAAPLYGQAERFELGPLPATVASDYVAEQFASTGRTAGPALRPLVQAAAGHPQRLNLLAHHLWNLVVDGGEADDDAWQEAYNTSLTYVRPELLAVWSGIGGNHRKALRLIAWGEPLFGAAAHRLGLSGGSATAAREVLEQRSVIEERGTIIDPLLTSWIRHEHPSP